MVRWFLSQERGASQQTSLNGVIDSASPFKGLLFVCFSRRTHLLQRLRLKDEKAEARGVIPPPKKPPPNYDAFPGRPSVVPPNLAVRAPLGSQGLPSSSDADHNAILPKLLSLSKPQFLHL